MEPAGINDTGDVVGNSNPHRKVFWYASGTMYDITQSISPAGAYTVLGSFLAGSGLSNNGEFLASQTNGKRSTYFIIKPASP